MDDDPYRLERFVTAQDAGGTYEHAVDELRAGAKRSHWMWFIFPQVAGLGFSAMSQRYAIASLAEARAYLAHPVLGPRLVDCVRILAATEGRSAAAIFGGIDAMKLRSSMTLFMAAAPDEPVFREVLEKYFGGQPDDATLERLALPANAAPAPSRARPPTPHLRAPPPARAPSANAAPRAPRRPTPRPARPAGQRRTCAPRPRAPAPAPRSGPAPRPRPRAPAPAPAPAPRSGPGPALRPRAPAPAPRSGPAPRPRAHRPTPRPNAWPCLPLRGMQLGNFRI
jgi:uncharacterized protein (DUF1810 family)